jgi:hypothetical protein
VGWIWPKPPWLGWLAGSHRQEPRRENRCCAGSIEKNKAAASTRHALARQSWGGVLSQEGGERGCGASPTPGGAQAWKMMEQLRLGRLLGWLREEAASHAPATSRPIGRHGQSGRRHRAPEKLGSPTLSSSYFEQIEHTRIMYFSHCWCS